MENKMVEKVVLRLSNGMEINAEKYGCVYKTKCYDAFDWLKGNRKPDIKNIAKLTYSMKERLYPTVIIINEKGEIIDGQHRFISAKSLGLEIYFMIVEGLTVADAVRMNSNGGKKWDYNDYLSSHISMENENYVMFENIVNEYGINIGDVFNVMSNIGGKENVGLIKKKFMDGDIVITDELTGVFNDIFNKIEDFNMFDGNKDTSFVKAFTDIYFFSGYSHDQMRKKLDKYSKLLIKCSSKQQYLEVLTDIYSKNEKAFNKIISVNKKGKLRFGE